MELPKKQELRTPMCKSGSDIIDSGDTEGRNNKARERDSESIPELPRKHAPLILKHESDSDIPDSNKDMDRKVEDNKTNHVEGGKENEKVNNARKPGTELLVRIRPVHDALGDNEFEDGTRVPAKAKSDKKSGDQER